VQFYGCYGVRNELATTGAEAAKKIAEAKGNAKSTATRAQGKADANRIRQTLITPQLLECSDWRIRGPTTTSAVASCRA